MSNARICFLFIWLFWSQASGARAEDVEVIVDDDAALAEKEPAPLATGALFQSGSAEGQQHLSLSPNGKQIATAGQDGKIRFYDTANAKLIKTVTAHSVACNDISFTPDGKRLISCGADMIIKEWDIESDKELREFKGHAANVKSVACSPDGLLLASSDAAATIRIWDLETGQQIHALTGHKVLPQDLPAEFAEQEHICTIDALVFSPNSRVVLSEANDVTARLWDAIGGNEIRLQPHHDGSTATLAFSPDGIWCVSTRGQGYCASGPAARLWNASSGETRQVFTGHTANVTCLAFSPDGRYIFSGADDNTLRQWEVDSGLELRQFMLASAPLDVACASNGKFAATVSSREGVVIWDLNVLPPTNVVCANLQSKDAWAKLAANNYHERAAAFRYFIKQLAPIEAVSQLTKGMQARLADTIKHQVISRAAIKKLDDDSYSEREKAFEDLRQLGLLARDELVAALSQLSLETRARAATLLKELGGAVDIRQIAALEILGMLNTTESRAELIKIAQENRQPFAAHAQAILNRISR